MGAIRVELEELAARMRECRDVAETELGRIDAAVAGLVGEETTEDVPAADTRARYEARLVECRLQLSRIEEWIARLDDEVTRAHTDILLDRASWWENHHPADSLAPWRAGWPWWVAALLLALLPVFRSRWPRPREPASVLARLQPLVVAALSVLPAMAVLVLATMRQPELGIDLGWTFARVALAAALVLGMVDALPARQAHQSWKHPAAWLLITGISAAVILVEMGDWPLPLIDPQGWSRTGGIALLALLAAWVALLFSLRQVVDLGRILRAWSTIAIGLLALAALAWAADRLNLASFIINGTVGTTIVLLAAHWLYVLVHDTLDGLDTGQTPRQRWVRQHLGLRPGEPMAAGSWIRIAFDLVLFILLVAILSTVWRLPILGIPPVTDVLRYGFQVGQVEIVPYDVVAGLVIFAGLVIVTQKGKRMLANRLIQRGRVGARSADAAMTVFGYLGVFVAALVGLTVAGVSFGNLALVAGALSVGIGFGLQNVVNNFVSGLILLFERPVKAGDLIQVGSAEGFVSRIRVRSTEIQGFDRSEIIVPNSEMISQQVTNLTLHDGVGRIAIKVGVAYGSDVEKVREVLHQVVAAHPEVIKEGELAPRILFWEFGDSALNFEVRCYLDDVLKRFDVRSELNFAIDRAFREAGIVIPFPQRTVHLPESQRKKLTD